MTYQIPNILDVAWAKPKIVLLQSQVIIITLIDVQVIITYFNKL